MNRLSYLQLEKENAEHFELAKPLWLEFNKEVNEHDGITEIDEEILTDLTDFNVNTVSSDDARYVTMLYGKNVEALHGRLISYSEWCSLLSAEDMDERHFLIRKGAVPCAYLKVNGLESGDNIGWISMLVVEPAFHRKGIGSYAVSYAEGFLRDMGKSIIKIHTTSDNTPAQKLYEKCGYILTDNNSEQLTYTKS